MKLVPFKAWHMEWLMGRGDAVGGGFLTPEMLIALEAGQSWTGEADGVAVACGGLVEQWPGRYTAWVFMNQDARRHMLAITRAVRSVMGAVKGRIEMTVRCDFAAGHRWAKMLGFEVETPVLKAFGPEGEDHVGYVRIR